MGAYADRVQETTITTGTGTLTLSGAVTAHRTFAASVTAGGTNNLTDGGTTRICIMDVDSNGNPSGAWEVCTSVFTVSSNDVTRGTLQASSTGSRISFAAGTKRVFVAVSADEADSFAAKLLTGLSLAATTTVAATHTILEAIGFLQAQNTAQNVINTSYRTLQQVYGTLPTGTASADRMFQSNGSSTMPLSNSNPGAVVQIVVIYLRAADYPTINSVTTKLRLDGVISADDAAPTGTFTFGLYAVSRYAGGATPSWTIGALVTGSNGATVTAPAIDNSYFLPGADFTFPADGFYAMVLNNSATLAANATVAVSAMLKMRN